MAFDHNREPANTLDSFYSNALVGTAVQVGVDGRINLYGAKLENNTASAMYVQFFNAASTGVPTVGTTIPDWTVMVPASGVVYLQPERAKKWFAKGCFVAATTTRTGATGVATAATVDVWYSQR